MQAPHYEGLFDVTDCDNTLPMPLAAIYLVSIGRPNAPPHPKEMTTITTIAGTAGRITGTAILYGRQLNDQIDWAEVAQVVIQGLQVAIVLTLLAGRATRRAWDALPGLSEQLGRWYASKIAPMPFMIAPVVARINVRQQLESMTCRQLMELTGIRRKVAKAKLIELALAI